MGKGPGGKHDNMRTYSPEEAQFVHQLVQEFHPQWTLIAKKTSDAFGCERSAASVRNYYKRFQQSKTTALKGMAKNRCQLCNQIKRGHICTPMQATPRTRVGASGDENFATNVGQQSMEVEVVGLAKPLAPDNGLLTLGGMFDDIIFPTAANGSEPSPMPRMAPPAPAEPVFPPIAPSAHAAPVVMAPVMVVEPPAARVPTCVPTVEVEADEEEPPTAHASPVVMAPAMAPAPFVVAPPPPVMTLDEYPIDPAKGLPPALASASSLLALSTSPMPRFSLPSPEDASIPA